MVNIESEDGEPLVPPLMAQGSFGHHFRDNPEQVHNSKRYGNLCCLLVAVGLCAWEIWAAVSMAGQPAGKCLDMKHYMIAAAALVIVMCVANSVQNMIGLPVTPVNDVEAQNAAPQPSAAYKLFQCFACLACCGILPIFIWGSTVVFAAQTATECSGTFSTAYGVGKNLTIAFWAFIGSFIVIVPCCICLIGAAAIVSLLGAQNLPGLAAQHQAWERAAAAARAQAEQAEGGTSGKSV